MKADLRVICSALLAVATCAYVGILLEARTARDSVVDTVVYGARLAADGGSPLNTAFDSRNGSAAIGLDYRQPSAALWTVVPLKAVSATQWIFITAEEPQFFSADGEVRVYADTQLVGTIHARTASGTTFRAEPGQQSIFVPPEQTFGYRFDLGNGRRCTAAPCRVTILGSWTFWHIFRISVMGETPRFARSQAPAG